uniref:RNA helicase n=1 Tax=Chromera velia CCMP2878 TaxID=1169474 RepID=A0A0G4HV88_9ALVE|mmetsp:Transcript_34453/g.68141  ORF Transcript_34453/g.68141 Transcript_34453/m.68141 type:complete len:721 (+) Transcript_34453:234-2396(+)|eukprot:Cvel_1397.t1-p1 / transcript=Cvel_1397.t1 / gene=Cvel_1397 / organism=Chromera_velia_CCMP2878 / gene_product=DEAD-box ATP-dependent RNA helicase 21, putative / transcript_product=DEAD-box ATP-dependent RNA helicase 21, putative / location=Cvel_scaffold48:148072-157909(-) / protein_length=720 / sequence_SO=supercontig / SO=protein_coding / is_pseudo=false
MKGLLPQKRNIDPSVKAAGDAPFRVAFMSKKQREEMAQKQKEEQASEEKKKKEAAEKARRDFLAQEEIRREKERLARNAEKERERRQREEEQKRREEEMERQRQKNWTEQKEDSSLASLHLLKVPRDQQDQGVHAPQELQQIRSHYLGMKEKKKKVIKPSEKFKTVFTFDWDASEDTSRGDMNPLYQTKVEPQLLFGRGYRAGIDIREQRKQNAFYDTLVKRRVEREGDTEMLEEIEKQQEAADKRVRDANAEDGGVHWTEKAPGDMTERDWKIFREDFQIYIKGSSSKIPLPMRSWKESPLNAELLKAVDKAGYEKPTPIQMQAIPIGCQFRDLIGIAETGSGKTAAFVLPMLTYVMKLPLLNDQTSSDGPYSLVLAPTRELAEQIEEETKKFAANTKIRTVCIIGGTSAEVQAFSLRQGVEIVVGTPGRIKDCLEKAYTVLNQCNYVVMDEADRMIDMGFEDIVTWILDQIPNTNMKSEDEEEALRQELEAKAGHRQYRITSMFSATMPPAVEKIARKYLRSPAYISIGDPGAGKRAIEQRLEFMPEGRKKTRLQELLDSEEGPIMVFVNQKKVADVLQKSLEKMNYSCVTLHGSKAQDQRQSALQGFKDGTYTTLIATDVAGRGIDVPGVRLVINFDMPKEIEQYTHRIGRTGRAGAKGVAISFVTEEDQHLYFDLRARLVESNNIVPHELSNHPASKQKVKPGEKLEQKKSVMYAK